jgi:hypothetical protein
MRGIQIATAFILMGISIAGADDSTVDLTKIDRTIVREPKYQSQPHYALLVFGPRAEHRAWLVIDGDSVAYVDRNGNGDLTDPADRVELDVEATSKIKVGGSGAYKAMNVFPLGEVAKTKLIFKLWIRNTDFDAAKDDFYRTRLRELDEKQWINGSMMRVVEDGSQVQNPLLLTVRAEDAQIAYFNGPSTFALKWLDHQRLEPWPKQTTFDVHIGTQGLLARNCDEQGFAFTRMATSEVPPSIQPVAKFEFRSASADGKPITRELPLDQRCCGDTLYALFTLPKEAMPGDVKVTVRCPEWNGHEVVPATFNVPINQGIARHGESTYVMFHAPEIEIEDAVSALRRRGLNVFIHPQGLIISENDQPAFSVRLVRSQEVQETSAALANGTAYAEKLSQCDARFEITLGDVDKILQKPKTLNEIRSALQELTHGYSYNTWDKTLSGPR